MKAAFAGGVRAEREARRRDTRGAILVALLLSLPACDSAAAPEPFALDGRTAANLTVEVDEEVTGTTNLRRFSVSALGTPAGGGLVRFRIDGANHEIRTGDDRRFRRADTRDAAPAEDPRFTPDQPMRIVLDGLLDREFTAQFDPAAGLLSLSGLDAALAAAAPAGDDAAAEARDGLRSVLSDDALARNLRNAGLGSVPPRVGVDGPLSWTREVFVPGSGVHDVLLTGNTGREHEGSRVVRGKGRPDGRTPPRGDPGLEPPLPVDPATVELTAETLYDGTSRRPLRGNTTTRIEYGSRISTNTRFRFTFTVR